MHKTKEDRRREAAERDAAKPRVVRAEGEESGRQMAIRFGAVKRYANTVSRILLSAKSEDEFYRGLDELKRNKPEWFE